MQADPPTAAAAAATHALVSLGPELTIAYAAASRDTLLQALAAQAAGLTLDLSGVTDFDSAGVQLLLATARSLKERGQPLHLAGASAAVEQGLAVFGLQALLTPQQAGATAPALPLSH